MKKNILALVTAGLNRNTTDIGTGLGLSWRF